jgi:hypothetical protein
MFENFLVIVLIGQLKKLIEKRLWTWKAHTQQINMNHALVP